MKHLRLNRAIVAIAMMLIGWLPLLAYNFESGGIYYNITSSAKHTVEVTSSNSKYSGDIVIPETISSGGVEYSVTSIGSDAFYYCWGLTSVTIGNSVTSIGDCAFEGCSGLTSIEIPNSVTSIGQSAFYNCSGLTSVTIGNSVTSIGQSAFYNCSGLTSIEIPNSVTSIGQSAFYNCSGLTSVTIGNSVTSIGQSAFDNCSGLTNIEIPNSVTSIESLAFYNCSGLTSVTIGNSVTSIESLAFSGCSGLTSVTIGNSVTSIGDFAFSNCTGLTSIEIPNSVTSIAYGAFEYCSGLTSIEIPNSVTSIGNYAFEYCSGLTSVTIGNSVTSIGEKAFYYCTSLTSVYINDLKAYCNIEFGYNVANPVYYANNLYLNGELIEDLVIPEGVSKISDYLFYDLDHIKSVTIPNSVTSIAESAFEYCSGFTSIEIPNSVTSIGYEAFRGCYGLTSVVWNAIKCGDFAYYNGKYGPFYDSRANITSFTFGDSVEHIPAYLCYEMSKLTSIEIPNSVTSIGQSAFYNCSGLTSVTIGNSVTSIGQSAFYNCSGLTSVVWNAIKCGGFAYNNGKYGPFYDSRANITSFTFGDSVEHIPACLCYEMSKLTSIEIPNSVTSIGNSAFSGCTGLTNIEIPNSVTSIGNSAFSGCTGLTSIEIPNSVTSIGVQAFYKCSGLTSVTIGNSVTSIGDFAFSNCTGLTSIEIPNSVTSIGNYAFEYCSGLTSVTIGNSVTSIEEYTFYNCTGLTSVVWNAIKCGDFAYNNGKYGPFYDSRANITSFTFGDSVEHIPAYLCYEMSKLTSIEIPNSVTSIADEAFSGCLGLTEIRSLAQIPPAINSFAFEGVDKSIPVYVPTGCKSAYQSAEYWKEFAYIIEFEEVVLAESITLEQTEISLNVTETAELTATILPKFTENKTIVWSSSDESVATIGENGLVTAIAVGEAIITASTADGSNLSATCKVTVIPTLVVSIEVTPNSIEAEENSEVQLSVNILPENATYKSVEWSSSNDAIASVNADGLVKIYKEGNVVITATTTDGTNLSATCYINVYSGVDGVNGDKVIVATIGDNIVVKNAPLGSVVNVYASTGSLIASEVATDGNVIVESLANGIYVVAIDGKSFKVMVK